MNMKKFLILSFTCILLIGLFACSSQKKKAVEYYKKYYDYISKTHELDITKQVEETDKIAKSFGFKDALEANMTYASYMDEPEIKELQIKIDKIEADIRSEQEKKAEEELRKAQEQQKVMEAKENTQKNLD